MPLVSLPINTKMFLCATILARKKYKNFMFLKSLKYFFQKKLCTAVDNFFHVEPATPTSEIAPKIDNSLGLGLGCG